MEKHKKNTAFGLIRVSTSSQELVVQRESLRKIAHDFGYTINDDDFFEEKITGYDEPEYDRQSIVELREQITIRRPSAIFILELSRLTRRAIKVSHYIDVLSVIPRIPMYFADYDIWTIDPNSGQPNDDGILQLYGGAKSVELERQRITDRTKRGKNAKAKQGLFVGHVKDGYKPAPNINGDKEIVIDHDREPIITKIFELYLNGMSTSQIRDWLIAEDIPTTNKYRLSHPELFVGYKKQYRDRSGKLLSREDALWTDGMVSNILRDEWYIGKRKYNDETYTVPAIISYDIWDRVQTRLSEYRFSISTAHKPYLLVGLLECGKCGRKIYAHGDDYNNMYYCSSQEYGSSARCGARWIRQQNLDAIVFDIIKRRSVSDTMYEKQTPFADFFGLNRDKIKTIDEQIKTFRRLIQRAEINIEESKKQLEYQIEERDKNRDRAYLVDAFDKAIDKINNNIEKETERIIEYKVEERRLTKQRKGLMSLKQRLDAINSITDFDTIQSLIKSVVVKIQLYNPDKASTLIKINYINGKYDLALYAPTRMNKKYILLSNHDMNYFIQYHENSSMLSFGDHWLAIKPHDEWMFGSTENINKEVDDFYLSIGQPITPEYDTPEGKERYINSITNRYQLGYTSKEEYEAEINLYDELVKQRVICKNVEERISRLKEEGFTIFKDEISVIDYINLRRKDTLFAFEYTDLFPTSEKGLQRKEYNKEYHKRRNKGTSSSVAYIVKDISYEEVLKVRKRLYNQRYKALHHKSITDEERAERLLRIDEKLEVLKYQVKYMPTNAKGKRNIKRYNSSKDK